MKPTLIIVGGIFAMLALIVIVLASTGVGWYNTASRLKVQYDAKLAANHAELDNLKKKISQSAEVTDENMKALEKIFTGYAEARTPKGSEHALANWIKESVPSVDTSTFKNLQNIIVGSRDAWTMRQTEIVDISREYNSMLVVFPQNLVLKMFGFEKIIPTIVTSTETETAFKTGLDDNKKVFQK
jgi:hypothetical protein